MEQPDININIASDLSIEVVYGDPFTVSVNATPPPELTFDVIGLPGPPGAPGTDVHIGPNAPIGPEILWIDTGL